MGKPTGFMEFPRELPTAPAGRRAGPRLPRGLQPVPGREAHAPRARAAWTAASRSATRAARSGNLIPDWNDLVYRDQWRAAIDRLHATNNFPEFTGKLCPAPCEASCVLGINDDPVTIKQIEASIIDRAWDEGWVVPAAARRCRPARRSRSSAPGPAGLAAAQQLARAGHAVTVFERADRIGGLLRYGIPDFKMEKQHLDRRLEQMEAEGVVFGPASTSASTCRPSELLAEFDAVCLCGGATQARDLPIPGRELEGHPLRHGLPAAPEQAGGRRRDRRRAVHLAPRAST